ncbi:SMI1/KNR4 family protein [Achromobacter sp. NFACC18-2]|uniref:SMI1/KNR4 family protein n=1 Tax=Achromobacter sp. NFACC18-2 TaxID=1564112 RepID=UPI001113C28C|nr:SMI1/KNR4 family protein [Achromobacter sp. NFACC18-2]
MTLLTLDEIEKGLDQEFRSLEPMLTGLRLIKGGVSEESLNHAENLFAVAFPDAFRTLIKTYDFGWLTIGPILFCNTGDYLHELWELNTQVRWWGGDTRPANLLMVANSDPYSILLDLKSGWVMAADVEIGWQRATVIAKDFEVYLRGVGTIMLHRNQWRDTSPLGQAVAVDVGALDICYWSQLAK